MALLYFSERRWNFWRGFVGHKITGFNPLAKEVYSSIYTCPEWNAKVKKKYITESRDYGNYRRQKKPLSCHLVIALAAQNMNSVSLLELFPVLGMNCPHLCCITIPHIYNHCTVLNRDFSCLCWLPSLPPCLSPLICHIPKLYTFRPLSQENPLLPH